MSDLVMLENEYGMKPVINCPIKGVNYSLYHPDDLLKHPKIIDARNILKKMGMSDETFYQFLWSIWNWEQATLLQQTKSDYEDKMQMASDHIKKAIKILSKCGGPNSRASMRDAILHANKNIERYVLSHKGRQWIEFYSFEENENSFDISINDALTAIGRYCRDTKSSSYLDLMLLRDFKDGETRIKTGNNKEKKREKKKKKGQVNLKTNRLVVSWVYINLIKYENINCGFKLRYHDKHVVISKISSALMGKDIPEKVSRKTLSEVAKSHAKPEE
jgi:hypothetical protein